MGPAMHIILLSDTHLGFDEPRHPRSARPRRGPDFFAVYRQVLDTARAERVDAVIHGGDLFYRSRVPDSLVDRAMEPLVELASAGIPVILVPGNHERSFIPQTLFSLHDRIHILHEPRTVRLEVGGVQAAIGGFPFVREGLRDALPRLETSTGLLDEPAGVRLLCMHQLVEGVRVGPSGYQFTHGDDVARASDLPAGITAVICGHVHRHQVLRTDLQGRRLPAPVIYPGSTERTSFAEVDEVKGFISLRVGAGDDGAADGGAPREAGAGRVAIEFRPLPARPMYSRSLEGSDARRALEQLRASLRDVDARGVLRVRIPSALAPQAATIIAAAKTMVAPTVILSFGLPGEPESSSAQRPR